MMTDLNGESDFDNPHLSSIRAGATTPSSSATSSGWVIAVEQRHTRTELCQICFKDESCFGFTHARVDTTKPIGAHFGLCEDCAVMHLTRHDECFFCDEVIDNIVQNFSHAPAMSLT